MPTYRYPRPSVTVDAVILGINGVELQVLLIQRKAAPFKGRWALPGGFVHMSEGLDAAARRELKEETGIAPAHLEQLYTFGEPKRDPRGRVITVAYLALVRSPEHSAVAGSDAAAAQWFPVASLPPLAFDHRDIVDMAIGRLRGKIRYAPIGFGLLPEEFTLHELQQLYELLLGRRLDKANFRRKALDMEILVPCGERRGAHRPAQLYRFDRDAYERLTKLGMNFEI